MWQRIIAFSLLILHINGYMLLPHVDEPDVYNKSPQTDGLNSLTEFIQQIVLGMVDTTPEDRDQDKFQNYTSTKVYNEVADQGSHDNQIINLDTTINSFAFNELSDVIHSITYKTFLTPAKKLF